LEVRLTPDGRKAEGIWRTLFDDIEARWKERLGADEIDELKSSLRAIVEEVDAALPEYLPIVGGANGMVADLPSVKKRDDSASRLGLCALLAQTLLTYTLDFERASKLSLPLSANVVRVLDEKGVLVRAIPRLSGVSKEATSMALTSLVRSGYVVLEAPSGGTKLARLTTYGRASHEAYGQLHAEVEKGWNAKFGVEAVGELRSSLEHLLEHRDGTRSLLSRGLEPHPGGWRGSKAYIAHTQAVIDDPAAGLPHYPMVLHRGGWPDGS
jgi:DNA-binding MarR family transcriptional regulator